MLQCPKDTFARLFYNASSSFFLLLFFFHFTSIFLAKLFIFFGGNPFYQRNQEGYEFNVFSDEEVEEEDNEMYGAKSVEEKGYLGVADVFNVGTYHDTLVRDTYELLTEEEELFYRSRHPTRAPLSCFPENSERVDTGGESEKEQEEEEDGDDDESSEESPDSSPTTSYSTPAALDEDEVVQEGTLADSSSDSETNIIDPTSGFSMGVTTSHIEENNDARGGGQTNLFNNLSSSL